MGIEALDQILSAVRNLQKIGSFVGGVMFIFGLVMYLYAFKNPLKRRIAYLLTLMGPLILIFSIHGVVFIAHYMITSPLDTNAELGLFVFEPKLNTIGSNLYLAIQTVSYPVMAFVLLCSVAILHHACIIPGRKRIGYGIFSLVPVLFMVIEGGPWIYQILIS